MKIKLVIVTLFLLAPNLVSAKSLSEKHSSMDMQCKSCHVSGMTAPTDESCLACHGSLAELVKSTDHERKPHDTSVSPNPHDSAHFGSTFSCFACHSEHKESKVYCHKCHAFEYKNFK